jgi:hypothetical protein
MPSVAEVRLKPALVEHKVRLPPAAVADAAQALNSRPQQTRKTNSRQAFRNCRSRLCLFR